MSALSTGMQGAQIGGKFGGAWGAVGGAVLGFITGGKAEKRQNKATEAYNNQVVKYAAQDLFDLRRQQNVENIRTAQALSSYGDNKKVQNSAVTAAMGAADIIGSSAQALKQVMDFQTNEAKAEVMINWEQGIDNYNTLINKTTNQRESQFKRQNAAGQEDLGALVSGAVGLYKDYRHGGAGMVDDVKFAWQNRDQYANLGKNIVKHEAASLMGQLSSVWNVPTGGSSTIDILNQGVMNETAYTPNNPLLDVPMLATPNITPIN